ncbi:MAG: ferredoxin [Verrucomicrobiales bacterium]|nr:ferredoxin [Verrucomicrobiales bacterium]
MAAIEDRFEQNEPGNFYVDAQCIDCDLCRERIPEVFHRSDEGGHSYVGRQPQSAGEMEICFAALEDCPAEAIGSDGETI